MSEQLNGRAVRKESLAQIPNEMKKYLQPQYVFWGSDSQLYALDGHENLSGPISLDMKLDIPNTDIVVDDDDLPELV